MKNFLRRFSFASVLALAITFAPIGAGAQVPNLGIFVVDAVTGEPLAQTQVQVWSPNTSAFYMGVTDDRGGCALDLPPESVVTVFARDNAHYGRYHGGAYSWDKATQVPLPASVTLALTPVPVFINPFNVSAENINPQGEVVQYGILMENRTSKPQKFTLWATRSFPTKGPAAGSFPSDVKEEMSWREIKLAPGGSKKILKRFKVLESDPDGGYAVIFYLYDRRGRLINSGSVFFTKGAAAKG